jgi:Domain of unknown function (DUF4625)
MKQMYIFVSIAFLCLTACKHEDMRDKTLPTITINNPIANQHFAVGDTILIKGTINDINELKETGIHITSGHDNNEFLHLHYGLLYSNTWNFEVKHKIIHSNATQYEIEIEGIDATDNEQHQAVTVRIN